MVRARGRASAQALTRLEGIIRCACIQKETLFCVIKKRLSPKHITSKKACPVLNWP